MAKSLSLIEAVVATAKQKHVAAKSRSVTRNDLEKPKEAIFDALFLIAEELASDGYAFKKSGPRLSRIKGDLTFEVFFQSDRNNVAGVRAAVWIHASVSSQILAKWRRTHVSEWIHQEGPHAGRIVGAQIGNLNSLPGWMEWDFADQRNRRGSCEDAVHTIREIVFPFFESFNNPEKCLRNLMQHRMLWSASIIEYALSNFGQEAARQGLRVFLESNPELHEPFQALLSEFTASGVPKCRSSPLNDLAALVVSAGIDLG